jgi:hypothetical protein
VGKGATRRAHVFLVASSAWASLRSAHPTKKFQALSQLRLHLRIFAVVSSIFGRVEETPAMFHSKCFTPNKLDFRDLENRMNKFVDRA